MNPFYLRSNVQVEPLVNQWHAYPFIVAPASAAMFMANYQLNVMKSYVQMPLAHAAALKNPDMMGGPFINFDGKRVNEVKALREVTESRVQHQLEFARAVKDLVEILQSKAKGSPLEELYQEVPEALRGYLELTYDLDHKASFRFIERLLYHSNLYNREAQSIALTLITSDERPFIFSTPRLKDNKSVHLPMAFDDGRIEALNELKGIPREYSYIKNLLGIGDDQEGVFKSFLTHEEPVTTLKYDGEGIRMRYFGHACVLLETREATILTDPLISYKYDSTLKRYTFEDLPPVIDMVLITHAHHDHVVIETLLQLRSKIKTIVVPKSGNGSLHDPSLKIMLEGIGFKNVRELEELDTIQLLSFRVTGIPFYGEHCDLDINSKITYLIRHGEESFLICADSSNLNPAVYANVRKMVGPVKTLFVGMECTGAPMSWSYGSFFTRPLERNLDQVRRSKGANCNASLRLIDIFSIENVYLYAMGAEPWLNYCMALQHNHSTNTDRESADLLKACADRNVAAESLYACKELFF